MNLHKFIHYSDSESSTLDVDRDALMSKLESQSFVEARRTDGLGR